MSEDVFSIDFYLIPLLASAPLLGTLMVGLVICYSQRRRRPRVSKLIGGALFAELMLFTVGFAVQSVLFAWFAPEPVTPADLTTESEQIVWTMLPVVLWSLPFSAVRAGIWGTTLWAVLSVEDWQDGTTHL